MGIQSHHIMPISGYCTLPASEIRRLLSNNPDDLIRSLSERLEEVESLYHSIDDLLNGLKEKLEGESQSNGREDSYTEGYKDALARCCVELEKVVEQC